MITQDRLRELLHYDPDTGIFTRLVSTGWRGKVGDVAGYKNPDGYLVIMIDYKLYLAHRLAWLYTYGRFPEVTDHINGVRDDNRIVNLREVTNWENAQNKKKHTRPDMSLPTGVQVAKKNSKWEPISYRAHWHDISWKTRYSPSFNFIKCWSQEKAFSLAIAYREARISELMEQGASYTDRHGQ